MSQIANDRPYHAYKDQKKPTQTTVITRTTAATANVESDESDDGGDEIPYIPQDDHKTVQVQTKPQPQQPSNNIDKRMISNTTTVSTATNTSKPQYLGAPSAANDTTTLNISPSDISDVGSMLVDDDEDIEEREETLCWWHPRHHSKRDRSKPAIRGRRILLFRSCFAELIGTFLLMLMVTSAGVALHSADADMGTSIILGAAVAGLTLSFDIYCFFPVSGAHFNPCITLSLFFTGHVSLRRTCFFIISQILGGQLAMMALYSYSHQFSNLFDLVALEPATIVDKDSNSTTAPLIAVFFMEMIGTSILVLVNFKAAVDKIRDEDEMLARIGRPLAVSFSASAGASKLPIVPIAIAMGCTLAAITAISQGTSKGAFNPIRYLSTAIWSGIWTSWWCWLVAELLGTGIACIVHLILDFLNNWAMQMKDESKQLQKQYL